MALKPSTRPKAPANYVDWRDIPNPEGPLRLAEMLTLNRRDDEYAIQRMINLLIAVGLPNIIKIDHSLDRAKRHNEIIRTLQLEGLWTGFTTKGNLTILAFECETDAVRYRFFMD